MSIETYKQHSISSNEHDGLKELEQIIGRPLRSPSQIIHMLVDCSGSMEGEKLEAAKAGAIKFANDAKKQSHSIGLISFDSDAVSRLEPSQKLEAFEREIKALEAKGSTNLAAAIELAFGCLRSSVRTQRVIYIITDGMPNDVAATLAAADRAKRAGIQIMTLGTDDADRDFLAKLCSRPELAIKVPRAQLSDGVASMVKLLGN